MIVTVVIGDVVASGEIPEREEFQKRFKRSVRQMPRRKGLLSPYTLSAGDEVESVYQDPTSVLHDLWMLSARIYPQTIRFSVAIGAVSTAIDRENPLMMDGPAFHLARRGIDELKKSRELIGINAGDLTDVSLEHAAAQLLWRHTRTWKPPRWQVMASWIQGDPVAKIAGRTGLSSRGVYKNLHEGGIEIAVALAESIGQSLARKMKGLTR